MYRVSLPRKPTNDVAASIEAWLQTLVHGQRVCVAYSGGVDSSVLLHALARACDPVGAFELSAIHIHHGLSANADHWAAHCEATCRALGVPFHTVRVTVDDRAELGTEAAARRARYEALRAHASAYEGMCIALAHHARDQAETVLLQLTRGAGSAGLAAMPEHAPPFARPLLHVEKSAIDRYAQTHAIAHIVDESNDDERYARNRLRHRVWPALATAFPSAERTLARAAIWQHESDELANALALIDFAACGDRGAIDRVHWRRLDSVRRRNVLRYWLALYDVTTPSAERLLEWERQLLTERAEQNVTLTHASFEGSIRLYRERIEFVRAPKNASTLPSTLCWQGESELVFGERAIRFVLTAPNKQDTNSTYLRQISSGEKWVIRVRQESDSIRLTPNSIGRSMKNLFQDANVAPWLRGVWPILTCNDTIAAVPGIAVAHAFRARRDESGYALSWLPK
jgi:tRNA(Ile)-lysidine synthase